MSSVKNAWEQVPNGLSGHGEQQTKHSQQKSL